MKRALPFRRRYQQITFHKLYYRNPISDSEKSLLLTRLRRALANNRFCTPCRFNKERIKDSVYIKTDEAEIFLRCGSFPEYHFRAEVG
ncbi:hypothetical protein NPIL_491071 [Nephila pilipes]|uniref:Uncharacterized protein n=1 Tax=Nephila pilipes TaxID=299642 RepID=A0A8X6MVS7_NEPPI|nr:hypothetical protein NPIL_491071 [Nephila pilipes]